MIQTQDLFSINKVKKSLLSLIFLNMLTISSAHAMEGASPNRSANTIKTYFDFLPASFNNNKVVTALGITGLLMVLHIHRLYTKGSRPVFISRHKDIKLDGEHDPILLLLAYIKYLLHWYDDVIIGQAFKPDDIVADTKTGFLKVRKDACPPAGLLGNIELHLQIMKKTIPTVGCLLGFPYLLHRVYTEWNTLAVEPK